LTTSHVLAWVNNARVIIDRELEPMSVSSGRDDNPKALIIAHVQVQHVDLECRDLVDQALDTSGGSKPRDVEHHGAVLVPG
jgi:hypothetical protein